MSGSASTYGHAGITANYVGLLGEWATHRWLESLGEAVEPEYANGPGQFDIRLSSNSMTVEVKTSRRSGWARFGASISGRQADTIANTGGVIWCVVDDEIPPTHVWLIGWVPANELGARMTPWVHDRKLLLRVTHLDDPRDCIGWLAANTHRTAWARSQRIFQCAEGHRGCPDECLDCWWITAGGAQFVRAKFDVHVASCSKAPAWARPIAASEVLTSRSYNTAECVPVAFDQVAQRTGDQPGTEPPPTYPA